MPRLSSFCSLIQTVGRLTARSAQVCWLFVGLLGMTSTLSHAQEAPIIPVILVVDLQFVMERSEAAASLQAQLDVVNEKNQNEVAPQAESVRAARQRLQEARNTLSAAEFEAQRQEVERQVAAYQNEISTRKGELQGRMNRSMVSIQQRLQSVIVEIAGERGANIVLAKGAVIIMAGEFDVTNEALERLNASMPTVALAE